MTKQTLILIIILSLSFILRIYQINSNPPGLTWDEASLGYNAYSILKTGKDEYGSFLPITLKSFGDYKPAVYAYLSLPFIAVLGLNELAVRLPSVLSSASAPASTYGVPIGTDVRVLPSSVSTGGEGNSVTFWVAFAEFPE